MKPSVGRVVHYVSYGTPGGEYGRACRAAVITELSMYGATNEEETQIGIAVLSPTGLFFDQDAPYAAADALVGGTWHWPERVDE